MSRSVKTQSVKCQQKLIPMFVKRMITVLAAALSLGANANTIKWGMNDDIYNSLPSLQSIASYNDFTGDVIFILLDTMNLPPGNSSTDVCYYMKLNEGITSFNDVKIQPSILGVWEADIFDDDMPDTIFSIDDLGTVDYVQLVVLFLGSDTLNDNCYLTIPGEIIDVRVAGSIIIFQEFDPDVAGEYYFFYNIPEPGTGLLALVGASALLLRRRKGKF